VLRAAATLAGLVLIVGVFAGSLKAMEGFIWPQPETVTFQDVITERGDTLRCYVLNEKVSLFCEVLTP
jgi:hypothetical protein